MAWADILGQDVAARLLQTHLASGRVANAYLLVGPDGVGKRRLAREMAKALNCVSTDSRPCDQCRSCGQIERGTHPDVHLLVPGGASSQVKIDHVRTLLSRIALRPFSGTYQVAILDGAEHLTEEAANSLLKALEEPPACTRFLLLTAQVADCLPTVISRCQLIRCHPLPPEVVQRLLIEQQACELRMAPVIAARAGGSVSRALEFAKRWEMHARLIERFARGGIAAWVEQPLPESRQDVLVLLESMMDWLRDLVVMATTHSASTRHSDHQATLQRQARAMDVDRCIEVAYTLVALHESIEQFVSPRLVASLAREKWLGLVEPVR